MPSIYKSRYSHTTPKKTGAKSGTPNTAIRNRRKATTPATPITPAGPASPILSASDILTCFLFSGSTTSDTSEILSSPIFSIVPLIPANNAHFVLPPAQASDTRSDKERYESISLLLNFQARDVIEYGLWGITELRKEMVMEGVKMCQRGANPFEVWAWVQTKHEEKTKEWFEWHCSGGAEVCEVDDEKLVLGLPVGLVFGGKKDEIGKGEERDEGVGDRPSEWDGMREWALARGMHILN